MRNKYKYNPDNTVLKLKHKLKEALIGVSVVDFAKHLKDIRWKA